MAASWIVIKLDVIEYLRPRFVPCFIYLALDAFSFQQREKTFGNSIVMAISPATHAEIQVVIPGELFPVTAGILNPLI